MLRNVVPGSTSRLTIVDHNETYGRHILENIAKEYKPKKVLDLGCGAGSDLEIVKENSKGAELYGIDFGTWNIERHKKIGINTIELNIENEKLPFSDNSLDLVIANQVLEHTKEIFWINDQIFRILKPNGLLYIGFPNILSLHNRLLGLFGGHPTQHKLTSAHVRVFSKSDTEKFYKYILGDNAKILNFYGSQFYPFPKPLARLASKYFPNMSFSIFFLIQKTGDYNGEFLNWPSKANLETNFFVG